MKPQLQESELTVCLVVSYWRGPRWLGFDTYYLDRHGRKAGAYA